MSEAGVLTPHNVTIVDLGEHHRAVCSCGWSTLRPTFQREKYMYTSKDAARNDPATYAKAVATRHLQQYDSIEMTDPMWGYKKDEGSDG